MINAVVTHPCFILSILGVYLSTIYLKCCRLYASALRLVLCIAFVIIVGELNLKKWSNRSLHCKSLKFLSQADMT